MRAFVDKTAAMEGKDGVLSVSIGHCFPYTDVPEPDGRILVITDNDKAHADRLASEIGQEFVVDATVTVAALQRDCWQSFGPTQVPLGDCAAIRVGDLEVALISNRNQALGLELFRNLGIEPTQRKLVVVKSTNHFMAAFGPIARKVIYVDSNGPLSRDYRKVPYSRVNRPIWPIDEQSSPGLVA